MVRGPQPSPQGTANVGAVDSGTDGWHGRCTRAPVTTARPRSCTAAASERTRSGPDAYGAVDEAVSALGLARAEMRTRDRSSTSCCASPARALRRRRRARRPRPRTGASSSRASRSPPTTMVDGARADHRRHHRSLRTAHRVRAPGRESGRRRARRRPHRRAARGAPVGRRRARRAGCPTATWCPYLNRLADLVYTLARWQEGTFRPGASSILTPEEPVGLTFSVVTTPADRVAAELLAVPIAKTHASSGRAPTSSTPRSTAGSRRSSKRPGSRATWARRSRCPRRGSSRRRPRCSSASASIDKLTLDGLRRAAAAVARRAAQGRVRRHHARERRARPSRRRCRAGRRRRHGARRVPVPRVQARRQAHEALEGHDHRRRWRRGPRRARHAVR